MQVGQNRRLSTNNRLISKTVQDRRMVSIKVEQEVVCALSNGDIARDLECPLTAQNHFIASICSGLVVHVVSALLRGNWQDFN